jgi:oxygen-independent coproporphyrinogen-3 oxidase
MQYEVSNFALQGFESRHNTVYWNRMPYKGFGLGASSFDGEKRSMNEHNLMRYMTTIEQGGDPIIFTEQLDAEDERLEKIMLGLRRTIGIRYELLLDGLSIHIEAKIRKFCDAGLMRIDEDTIKLTTTGFVLEQEIIAELA